MPDELDDVDESPPDSELDPGTLGEPVEVPLGSDDGQPPEVPPDSPVGKEEPPLDPDEPPLEPEDPPPELPPLWDGDDCPPLVAQPAASITASANVGILNLIADSSRLLRCGEIIAPQERTQLVRHPIAGRSPHARDERQRYDRPDQRRSSGDVRADGTG